MHSVLLRGNRRGTPPTAVEVKTARLASLALHATALDSDVSVEPIPEGSTIFVDGVFVGNGAWTGSLPSGAHRFEVIAPGFLPFHDELQLLADARSVVHAVLNPNRPRADAIGVNERRPNQFYVEPNLGL